MKPIRAIYINAADRVVVETEVASLEDMQAAVGGLIETATILGNGDTLFVNEEGLLLNFETGFHFDGAVANGGRFVGSGILVGGVDDEGNSLPAKSKVKDVDDRVTWLYKAADGQHRAQRDNARI